MRFERPWKVWEALGGRPSEACPTPAGSQAPGSLERRTWTFQDVPRRGPGPGRLWATRAWGLGY